MTAGGVSEDEVRRRQNRRLRACVLETYARSSAGGFLYLVAWVPLVFASGLGARHPWIMVALTALLVAAAILRAMSRPSQHDAVAQARWMNRYTAVALSSTLIWTGIQVWVIADPLVEPLIKSVSLFGTVAILTALAHVYTSLLRMTVIGTGLLILPTGLLLWLDPQLHYLALALTLYAAYLSAVAVRSHADYQRRLDVDEALVEQRDRFEELSRTDSLTGLCNRRNFTEALNEQVREAQWLSGAGVALALLDIDHFKSINDRHGHVIGDEVLRHLAERLKTAFPEPDVVVARTGGEEFGLILRDYDEISTMIRAETFREALQAEPVVCAGIEIPLTVSIGVGSFHAERDIDDDGFYGAVDVALYAAKQQGRNRVVSVSMLEPGLIARRSMGRSAQPLKPPQTRPRTPRNA
jgi:diguanylate cyclase (GGDEF)-like protein